MPSLDWPSQHIVLLDPSHVSPIYATNLNDFAEEGLVRFSSMYTIFRSQYAFNVSHMQHDATKSLFPATTRYEHSHTSSYLNVRPQAIVDYHPWVPSISPIRISSLHSRGSPQQFRTLFSMQCFKATAYEKRSTEEVGKTLQIPGQ